MTNCNIGWGPWKCSHKCIIFYCCITHNNTFSSLKQHTFITSRFPWISSLALANLNPLFRTSQAEIMMSSGLYFFLECEILFQIHMVVSKIHLLMVVESRPSKLRDLAMWPSHSHHYNLLLQGQQESDRNSVCQQDRVICIL